ncbi:MAG: ribonuclease III [Roseiflexaceae bacterium]|nr:ribonuclease III [Roseiflexaceae bacterium]
MKKPLDELCKRLNVTFSDQRLLQQALTHSSFLNERVEERLSFSSNERLEFLGDAIVNFLATKLVFERFPAAGEGDLTAWRSALIRTETLASFARRYELGSYVLLARGEELSGARQRPALLADAFEAVVAAIFIDQGLDAVQQFLLPLFEEALATLQQRGLPVDYKSKLQARIQAERGITPRYRMVERSGPEHQPEFTFEALAGDKSLGRGRGSSRQAAEQDAARVALDRLENRG